MRSLTLVCIGLLVATALLPTYAGASRGQCRIDLGEPTAPRYSEDCLKAPTNVPCPIDVCSDQDAPPAEYVVCGPRVPPYPSVCTPVSNPL